MNAGMTQQGQDVCFGEGGIGCGSIWLGEGSPLVHTWIAESIQGALRIESGSPRGASEEHPRIVCLRKIVSSPRRYGRIGPSDLGESDHLIGVKVSQGEPDNHLARSSIDPLGPGTEPAEPVSTRGDPCLCPWESEVTGFEC